ncbi:MAG: hypothetical protein HY424_00130 [Candidatus Levybacteria bacterium]|nr:hypothetical protein [Candidatus Levybacteria bacterium]
MIARIKKLLYFPIAYYFRFWAGIQLSFWNPKIVVITGSSGKTTLLHLIESQLGSIAKYSHHANSSYGIPFDILGLMRKNLTFNEWFFLFLLAPFKAFKKIPKEKIYVVEADCDRPREGKFLASLLRPEITLWISSSLTHSINFDSLVKSKKFATVETAITFEFGYFLEYTRKLAIVNGDSLLIRKELQRTKVNVRQVTQKNLKDYKVYKDRTEFMIDGIKYSINYIVPKNICYSIQMANLLLKNLEVFFDPKFSNFILPPGRNSVFKGIKNTTIIDSTYNATPDGVKSILELFDIYPAKEKWLVLGDIIELGNEEGPEHEKIAEIINRMKLSQIILIGPRVSKYTYPKLAQKTIVKRFLNPKEGLNYILANVRGSETLLFKGARFLEGIIEKILLDKDDIKKLVRRELAWQNRRKVFGL